MNALLERPLWTFDEFMEAGLFEGFELVDGRLVEKAMSTKSGWVANEVAFRLTAFCKGSSIGVVLPSEIVYRCFPGHADHGRRPDVTFLRNDRLPAGWLELGYFAIAPDLAVEVLSPSNSAFEMDRKIQEYLAAGVRLVWEINPDIRIVHVYRNDGTVAQLREADELSGEGVLPGFTCRVGDLFPAHQTNS